MRRRPPWILSSRPKMLQRFSLLSASPLLLRQYLLSAAKGVCQWRLPSESLADTALICSGGL
jgi:hypothetical protein